MIRRGRNKPWKIYRQSSVLAHELCGHADLYNRGMSPHESDPDLPMHTVAIKIENEINEEHGWPLRPEEENINYVASTTTDCD